MIKIIVKAFQPQIALLQAGRVTFCTNKVDKKTSDINAMFTDRGIEETKEKKITSGKNHFTKDDRGKPQNCV